MKASRTLIILLLLVSACQANSQLIYVEVNGTDTIIINENTISFNIGIGGLEVRTRGTGEFKLLKDYLIIRTWENVLPESTVEIVNDGQSRIMVHTPQVEDLDINVGFRNESGKVTNGLVVKSNEWYSLLDLNNVADILVSKLGSDSVIFDVSQNMSYVVNLLQGSTIENQIVVFKVIEKSESRVWKLISLNAEEKDISSEKCLNRLERKQLVDSYQKRFYQEM